MTAVDERPIFPRSRGVLLAAVVVLAATVGVAAVRTVDVQPPLDDAVDVDPSNATATVEAAIERTAARDLITDQRTDVHNASTGEWERSSRRQALLQRSDRSVRYYRSGGAGADGEDRAIHATDGRLGMLHDPTPPATPGPHQFAVERGPWTVLVGAPYGWGIEERFAFPPADAAWRLADETDHTLVYRVAEPATLSGHGIGPLPDVPAEGVTPGEESGATIVVDRSTLTVRRASVTVDYVDDRGETPRRVATRWERRVTKIGDVTASRPGSLGKPSLLARLWDVVYY